MNTNSANDELTEKVLKACAQMSVEYKAAKQVISVFADERKAAADQAFVYQQIINQLKNLRELDATEKSKLLEIIENFRLQLKNRDETIAVLKKQKNYSVWDKTKLVLMGIGLGVVIEKIAK